MELVVLTVLALVVAAVAIDAIAHIDRKPERRKRRDPGITTTQKIIVDLSKRR